MEKYIVKVNGKEYEVEIEKVGAGAQEVKSEPEKAAAVKEPAVKSDAKGTALEAGAAGKVWKILKKPGDKVEKGETAVILEAMKMEIPMVATVSGVVNTVFVSEGQPVEAGDKLLTIE
jgi:biotin carboxyl carrier protein